MKQKILTFCLISVAFLFSLHAPSNIAYAQKGVSFTDALGASIAVKTPIRRMVVINGDAAEILCALGAEDRIVGISSHIAQNDGLLSGLKKKAVVGTAMNPSIEKIIGLQPDLVIAYEMWMTKEAFEDKLSPLGIAVARMYCYRLNNLDNDIRTLGRLVDKEKCAEDYLQYIHAALDQVARRLEGLPKRKRIYNEGYGAYKTVSDGSGADKLLEAAKVTNIAAGQPVPWPEITAEWVVEKDPDLMVKAASSHFVETGFGAKDRQAVDAFFQEFRQRPAWNQTRAVRENRVHILSNEIWVGPRAPIGILYIAKWAYPERFTDLDPSDLHRKWLMQWHHKALEGIYVYP